MSAPKIYEVPLTRDMWDEARSLAESIKKTGLFRTANYTGLSEANRFVTGYVGEFAVERFFRQNKVKFWHRINADGKSQISELSGWIGDLHVLIEVKASSKEYYKKLMWPAAQPIDAHFVIGVRLSERRGVAQIMGFLCRGDIEKRTQVSVVKQGGISTRHCDYTALNDIDELLGWLVHHDVPEVTATV